MKRSMTRWTTAFAATLLLGMPAAGRAQTGTAQQPTTAPGSPSNQQQSPAAQEHLREARTALDRIEPTAVTGRAKTQLAELKRRVASLERAGNSTAKSTKAGAKATWSTDVAAADKIIVALIGPESSGATGTSGSAAATVTVDEPTRAALTEVRKHLTQYAAAMSGTATSAPGADDPAAATATAQPPAASQPPATAEPAPQQPPATAQSPAPAQPTTPPQSEPAPGAQPQVDAETARRHLTEARETLSQLTQLPAAATLSGDARTQVSQLISNFNELITTQTDWRGSYAKVEGNLNALLGPEDQAAAATPAPQTGTAGAVGTSGSAATNLDPAIRTKLVELRTKLNEFERAAGGDAAAASAPASAAASTTGAASTTAATPATGATPTTGAPATGSTTGAATAQTQPPSQPQPQSSAGTEMSSSEAMQHIMAIEAILGGNTVGAAAGGATTGAAGATSGTAGTTGATRPNPAGSTAAAPVTLTPTQVEQLKMHLNELKKIVEKK